MTIKSYHALAMAKAAAFSAIVIQTIITGRHCVACGRGGGLLCAAVAMPVTSWGTCPDFAPAGVVGVLA